MYVEVGHGGALVYILQYSSKLATFNVTWLKWDTAALLFTYCSILTNWQHLMLKWDMAALLFTYHSIFTN